MIEEEIKPNAYCRTCLKANKHDCDVKFYEELLTELEARELWKFYNQVLPLKASVANIKSLTIQHSKSLDDFGDQQHARDLTDRIKDALMSLDTRPVKEIVSVMDRMGMEGVTSLVIKKIIQSQEDDKGYVDIVKRLRKSIHNKELRTEQILTLGLFRLLNPKGSVQKIVNTYKFMIEKSMEELKTFKAHTDAIPSSDVEEILNTRQFLTYLEGSKRILIVALKAYEILKLLEGQSNYKFKLNNLRIEMNNILNNFNSNHGTQFTPLQQVHNQPPKAALQKLLSDLLEGKELTRDHLCFLCLDSANIVQCGEKWVTPECWNLMRYLSQKQQQQSQQAQH